ncbi:MAG: alpha-ketoglutarate-dependent dioxygenase AlkB [Bacteroidota bacterium]
MQPSLFRQEPVDILPYNGEAILYSHFFSAEEINEYFNNLLNEIEWKQEPIKIFGKEVMQPRLTAWHGDSDKPYTYSGITMQPHAWTKSLEAIRKKIEPIAGIVFTSALLNLYRDGSDSMGWHRDNEKELGNQPIIGSVSFGATRTFQFRNYKTKKDLKSLELSNGSFLLMRGDTNHYWEHQVPKTKQVLKERVNITFRVIY